MHKLPKLFDQWNQQKRVIEFGKKLHVDVHVGEFWRYREGVNIGNEISKDGKFMRVGLILSNRLGNNLLLIAPITTKYHTWMSPYYIKIENFQRFGLKESWLLINQVKLVDKKRIINPVTKQKSAYLLVKKVKYRYRDIIK